MWLPTTIIAQSSPTLDPGVSATSGPTGVPASLPKVITPPDGTVSQPEDTSLIQVGFLYPLNYKFVVSNSLSSAQIFQYLPIGIAYGLGLRQDQVTMKALLPLDTSAKMDFITTLAQAWIPTSMVSTLGLDLHIPTSALYNNPDASVNTLVNYINPAIPLTPGEGLGGGASGTESGGAATSTSASGNSAVFNTDAQNQSAAARGTTAGVAMGIVGGAAAYGAAMFLLARRYKRRRTSHRRSSSVMNPSEMRQSGSPALMGGAFMSGGRMTPGNDRNSRGSGRSAGNSARTQQISAPMMAENSLGWN
jgi:hypothetical protein